MEAINPCPFDNDNCMCQFCETPCNNGLNCSDCAHLYEAEIEANADNPKVIRERGANHLVIAVYRDHWHVAQVGGYTPDTGLYTKLY